MPGKLEADAFDSIAKSLAKIANVVTEPHYTLTGASDWNLLVAMFGIVGGFLFIIIGLIVYTWQDNKKTTNKNIDLLWDETKDMRDKFNLCKEKCLGRRNTD